MHYTSLNKWVQMKNDDNYEVDVSCLLSQRDIESERERERGTIT